MGERIAKRAETRCQSSDTPEPRHRVGATVRAEGLLLSACMRKKRMKKATHTNTQADRKIDACTRTHTRMHTRTHVHTCKHLLCVDMRRSQRRMRNSSLERMAHFLSLLYPSHAIKYKCLLGPPILQLSYPHSCQESTAGQQLAQNSCKFQNKRP